MSFWMRRLGRRVPRKLLEPSKSESAKAYNYFRYLELQKTQKKDRPKGRPLPEKQIRKLFDVVDVEGADVYEVAGQGCCCGHYGADQVGAAVFSLAAFEIAVTGAGGALVGREDVGVHADAHAAARIAPFETGVGENFVETFFFGLGLDAARAGNDESLLDTFGDVLTGDEVRGGAKVVDAGIGAGADEDAVDWTVDDGSACFEAHVLEGALGGFLIVKIFEVVRIGNARGDAGDHAGVGAPGDLRSDLLGLEFDSHVELGAVVGGEKLPAVDGLLKGFAAGNEGAAFEIGKSGVVGRDHPGAGASFDGHVADGHAAVHGKRTDGFAAVFGDVSGATADSNFPDDGED